MAAVFLSCVLTVLANLFTGRLKPMRNIVTIVFSFTGFLFVIYNLYLYFEGKLEDKIYNIPFAFFTLQFGFDLYGLVFAALITLLWGIAAAYSFSYMGTNYPEKSDGIFQFSYSLSVFFFFCFL